MRRLSTPGDHGDMRATSSHVLPGVLVNDVHARLSSTRVREVRTPRTRAEVAELVAGCAREGLALSVAGGRHSMGAQAFATDGVLLDTRLLKRVRGFDPEAATIEVDAGIQWPELIAAVRRLGQVAGVELAIAQKQTGADRMSLGGSLSANAHGRGLELAPLSAQIVELLLVDAHGQLLRCSRSERAELFALVLGGYGLFGIVCTLTLQLVPRLRLARRVQGMQVEQLPEAFERRIGAGCRYGDFQFAIDSTSSSFLREGVLACYEPTDAAAQAPRRLSQRDWIELLRLAHIDKRTAFERYRAHYLATDGQVYESDTMQLSEYLDDYHVELDSQLGGPRGSEMITELYVPRTRLVAFLEQVRAELRARSADLIYGTIRLVERDEDSFLAWARQPWACVVLNLHVEHSPAGLERASSDFRALIELALAHDGSYYLTYHRWATRAQALRAHPRLPDFLAAKRRHDPDERFQSDWYRHHCALLIGTEHGRG